MPSSADVSRYFLGFVSRSPQQVINSCHTGSIISSQTILTAAHCTDDALRFEITMGDHKRSDNEGTEVTVNSTDYIIHPEWRPFLLNNDYSLIYLSQPISFTRNLAFTALI